MRFRRGAKLAGHIAGLAVGMVWATDARATCPANPAALRATLDEVVEAFGAMDVERFYERRDMARTQLPCLDRAITPSLAAAYHDMEALNAFLGRDQPSAVAAFRAAVAADPAASLPDGLAMEGNPLYEAWQEASAAPPSATEVARVEPGAALLVDGHPAEAVPTERPAVIQSVGDEVRTAWVDGPAAMPSWVEVGEPEPEPVVVPVPPPGPVEPERKVSTPLLIVSGVTAAAAGGLLAGGFVVKSEFDDPETPYEDLESLRATANGLGVAAQVTGIVAIGMFGLGVSGVF